MFFLGSRECISGLLFDGFLKRNINRMWETKATVFVLILVRGFPFFWDLWLGVIEQDFMILIDSSVLEIKFRL